MSSLDDLKAELSPLTDLIDASIDNIEITEDEVIDVIVYLDSNKASGPDLISNKMLKRVSFS